LTSEGLIEQQSRILGKLKVALHVEGLTTKPLDNLALGGWDTLPASPYIQIDRCEDWPGRHARHHRPTPEIAQNRTRDRRLDSVPVPCRIKG
jgi:hypothetical protein